MDYINRADGISQKYDASLDYGITMYDRLPYQRDSDVCNDSTRALFSGHVIKYYLCNNTETAFAVDNQDDKIEQILQKVQQEEQARLASIISHQETDSPEASTDTISDEQVQTLLEDPGDTTPENTTEAAEAAEATPVPEPINLDDIEDW